MNTDASSSRSDAIQKNCFVYVNIDENDGRFDLNTAYKASGKTFVGSYPNLSYILDDLIELKLKK